LSVSRLAIPLGREETRRDKRALISDRLQSRLSSVASALPMPG
jgi:hypothetical protein